MNKEIKKYNIGKFKIVLDETQLKVFENEQLKLQYESIEIANIVVGYGENPVLFYDGQSYLFIDDEEIYKFQSKSKLELFYGTYEGEPCGIDSTGLFVLPKSNVIIEYNGKYRMDPVCYFHHVCFTYFPFRFDPEPIETYESCCKHIFWDKYIENMTQREIHHPDDRVSFTEFHKIIKEHKLKSTWDLEIEIMTDLYRSKPKTQIKKKKKSEQYQCLKECGVDNFNEIPSLQQYIQIMNDFGELHGFQSLKCKTIN